MVSDRIAFTIFFVARFEEGTSERARVCASAFFWGGSFSHGGRSREPFSRNGSRGIVLTGEFFAGRFSLHGSLRKDFRGRFSRNTSRGTVFAARSSREGSRGEFLVGLFSPRVSRGTALAGWFLRDASRWAVLAGPFSRDVPAEPFSRHVLAGLTALVGRFSPDGSRGTRNGWRGTVLAGRFPRERFLKELLGLLSGVLSGTFWRTFSRDRCREPIAAGRSPRNSSCGTVLAGFFRGEVIWQSVGTALGTALAETAGGRYPDTVHAGWLSRKGLRWTVSAKIAEKFIWKMRGEVSRGGTGEYSREISRGAIHAKWFCRETFSRDVSRGMVF